MKLVSVNQYGIKGINYYWVRRERFDLTREELESVGVNNEHPYLDQSIISNLIQINQLLKEKKFELFIKDAYRSPELYQLVFAKRSKKFGKAQTERIFNLETMPHSTGTTLDATLLDLQTGQEIDLRNKADDPEGFFVDFYKDRFDEQSQKYQELQILLRTVFLKNGFKLGTKNEFWHFELA